MYNIIHNYGGTEYVSISYYLDYKRAECHKWYYFPKMKKDEILLFKQFDSDPEVQGRFGFHTAIHDPNADKNTPKRESIEVRLIAFFPKHEPNTINWDVNADKKGDNENLNPIEKSIESLMGTVKMPQYWPKDARILLAKKLANDEGVEAIKWLVSESRKAKYHGLGDMNDEEVQQVVDGMIKRKDEFINTAKKNFPME